MAKIRVTADRPIYTGMPITFKAPCGSAECTSLVVYYPDGEGNELNKTFTLCDCKGENLISRPGLFVSGVLVNLTLDVEEARAYPVVAVTAVEHGEWTPEIIGDLTLANQVCHGWYSKVGNVVTVGFAVNADVREQSGRWFVRIAGLPYAPKSFDGSRQGAGGGILMGYDSSENQTFVGWKIQESGAFAGTLEAICAYPGEDHPRYSMVAYAIAPLTAKGTICYMTNEV